MKPNIWIAAAAGVIAVTAAMYLSAFSDPLGWLLYLAVVVAPFSLIVFMAVFVPRWRGQRFTIIIALAVYLVTTAIGLVISY